MRSPAIRRTSRDVRSSGRPGGSWTGPCDEAGIDRAEVYLTNAVKHFKWTERGKRRIHQRPNRTEIKACGFWLDAELGVIRPRLVVLLGAVAGEAVFGPRFRVGEHKGKVEEAAVGPWRGLVVSTIHPSAVLREDDPEARERSFAGLVADLVTAREALRRGGS